MSLRPFKWDEFKAALGTDLIEADFGALDHASLRILGGHKERTVRVRIGQFKFRQSLFDQFGAVCALTGPAPSEALEAGHPFSYASEGKHHDDGGLLLRRDIHSLFDRGLLCVHPYDLIIDVSKALWTFPAYQALQGTPLKVDISSTHQKWLERHWNQHRVNWREPDFLPAL